MPRDLSRTPMTTRRTRTATPGRLNLASSYNSRRACGSDVNCACSASHASPDAGVAPNDAQYSQLAVAARRIESDQEVPASEPAACPICFGDVTQGGDEPLWTWPCPCQLTLHLNCAVQLRFSSHLPSCPHCRSAWPGTSADTVLENACRAHDVEIARNWQRGPSQTNESEEVAMPAEPHDLVLLCCQRFIALDIVAGSRRMQWAPEQVYETIGQGCRRITGWIGEWVCNLCGRTFCQNEELLRTVRDQHCCGMGTRCRLSIDFQQGVYAWMCGETNSLSSLEACVDSVLPHADTPREGEPPGNTTAQSPDQFACDAPSYFTGLPPHANEESTNSFLYCPLLLHAAGMLQPHAVEAWNGAVPWFHDVFRHLSQHTVSLTFLSEAYAELLQISCQHDVSMVQQFNQTGDAAAAHFLHELGRGQADMDASLGLVVPGVTRADGHIPNQLQDFLLQVFGGYRLASDLDAAATHFRNAGGWPVALRIFDEHEASNSIPARVAPVAEGVAVTHTSGRDRLADGVELAASLRTTSEPPPVGRCDIATCETEVSSLVTVTSLHPHACSRQSSSRFGAQRRCTLCSARIERETVYFRCSQTCRFVACRSCFEIPPVAADRTVSTASTAQCDLPATVVAVQETEQTRAPAAPAPQLTHFTRYVSLPRDEYVQRVQSMIDSGVFRDIGRPTLRIEGPTSWGVWLRVCDPATSGAACGRVRCGVLYHVAQLTCYFHGEEQITREMLLPLFDTWTHVSLEDCPQRQPGAEFPTPGAITRGRQQLDTAQGDAMRQTHVAEHQVAVAGTVEGHAPSVVPPAVPALPVPFAASDVASTLEHGEVDNMPPPVEAARGVSVPVVPDLTEMSRLLGQILQHQAHMQQQIHDISVRLGDSSTTSSCRPQGARCSSAGCVEAASPGCVATMCLQHCADMSCAIHRPDSNASCRFRHCESLASPGCLDGCCGGHCQDRRCAAHAGPGSVRATSPQNACRRSRCSNGVSSACLTGYCPTHCTSRRCPCHEPASIAPLLEVNTVHALPLTRVCRRPACRNPVADACRTNYCTAHCSSRRCPCNAGAGEVDSSSRRVCRRLGCNIEVASSCCTGYCSTHCFSRRCSCIRPVAEESRATPQLHSTRMCRRRDCQNEVGQDCTSNYCPQHCRTRTCGCRSAASRLPPPQQPAHEPLRRRRVCRRSDCWLLVSPDCDSGFCPQHCWNASCSCTGAGPPGLESRVSSTRRCRRAGCQGVVDVACLTGYCQEHCTSQRCCGRLTNGRDEHLRRDRRHSPPVLHEPLRQYLSEMCSGIPENVGQLPAQIRNSLEELREFASAGGRRNVSGSRRHRQHRESRPM